MRFKVAAAAPVPSLPRSQSRSFNWRTDHRVRVSAGSGVVYACVHPADRSAPNPSSIAGVTKRRALGRAIGTACEEQGTIIVEVLRLVEHRKPRVVVFENVRNLVGIERGAVLRNIIGVLERLGYAVSWRVLNSAAYVPQNRRRVYIVGVREPQRKFSFDGSPPGTADASAKSSNGPGAPPAPPNAETPACSANPPRATRCPAPSPALRSTR